MVTSVVPSPPQFLPSIFIAHGVQQSHCSSNIHRVLLTHTFALSASPFVHKKKSLRRIYTSMHSGGESNSPNRPIPGSRITYTTPTTRERTRVSPGLIPPRTVWKPPTPPTGRSLIGWGSYIIESAPPGDDMVPSPVQRSFHISNIYTKRGRKSSSLWSTPPLTVWKPRFRWLKSLIGSSSTAPPHPRRMIEAHQPMGGSSVTHGGDRAPSRFRNPPNLYSSNNAGTITMISRVDTSPHGVSTPTPLAYS